MSEDPDPDKPLPRYKRKSNKRQSKKGLMGQKDRTKARRKELAELNVHLPRNSRSRLTAQDVKTVKDLKAMLNETWAMHMEKATEFSRFTPRQMEFARQYAINGRTNKVQAARLAGYKLADPENMRQTALAILKMPFIEDLITAFEMEEKAKMRINVEDVVKWFNDIAMKAMEAEDFTNANRAMENLAKYLGMFVERKEITHKTVHSRAELDARIAELTAVLKESESDIERKLRIN